MTHNKFGSPVKAARNHFQKLPIEVLERKHNFLTQVSPNPELDIECSLQEAILLARHIHHLNMGDSRTGMGFGQQHLFERGLKRLVKEAGKLE